jgi:hypothetical protein
MTFHEDFQLMTVTNAADIIIFGDVAVLYERVEDLIIVVTGSQHENEVILNSVLSAISEALSILLRCVQCCASKQAHCICQFLLDHDAMARPTKCFQELLVRSH